MGEDLRQYTCDAMAGTELYMNRRAMEAAKKRIAKCDMIFTTCIGAGLGLLRSEEFDIVIVDEASQQTEPASLVPLVKGCAKAILVGDHVQLRPTVQQLSSSVDFDVSLFERLFTLAEQSQPISEPGNPAGFRRLMLDVQYRMHSDICSFSSNEFYGNRLMTGISHDSRPLLDSAFPWPLTKSSGNVKDYRRIIWVDSNEGEAPGQKSKFNEGQAALCTEICKLLTTPASSVKPTTSFSPPKGYLIAVLTPYSRQVDLLRRRLTDLSGIVEVSTIDGFQGREADVVVFVTVRCNQHHEMGFLKDLRRLNVVLTRAKSGLIVIGNRATLTQGDSDPDSTATWKRLLGVLTPIFIPQ